MCFAHNQGTRSGTTGGGLIPILYQIWHKGHHVVHCVHHLGTGPFQTRLLFNSPASIYKIVDGISDILIRFGPGEVVILFSHESKQACQMKVFG
jgi:hypothetical protein